MRSKTCQFQQIFKGRNTELLLLFSIISPCSNADLFSLYYEPWHVKNIFIIGGIFRTLEYSEVRWYLDPIQTLCKVFGKTFQVIITFQNAPSQTILDVGQDSKCAYISTILSYILNATHSIQADSRLLQPRLIRHLMFQSYSAIFITTLVILRHICSHSGTFWQILAQSESWQSQT